MVEKPTLNVDDGKAKENGKYSDVKIILVQESGAAKGDKNEGMINRPLAVESKTNVTLSHLGNKPTKRVKKEVPCPRQLTRPRRTIKKKKRLTLAPSKPIKPSQKPFAQ